MTTAICEQKHAPLLIVDPYNDFVSEGGAIDTITKTLAKELGPRKIRVNAVNPGMVKCRLSFRSELTELPTSYFVDFAKPQICEATTSRTFVPNYSAVPQSPARGLAAVS